MVDIKFGSLSQPSIYGASEGRMATYTVSNPVVRECEDDFDSIFAGGLDDVVQTLEALGSVVQFPVALVPDLVVGQSRFMSERQFGCIDSIESLKRPFKQGKRGLKPTHLPRYEAP